MATAKATVARMATDNEMAAKLILQDVAKYGGPDSLMCQWAQAVVANATRVTEFRLVA